MDRGSRTIIHFASYLHLVVFRVVYSTPWLHLPPESWLREHPSEATPAQPTTLALFFAHGGFRRSHPISDQGVRGEFGWVGFLVVCFLYKTNPKPRKIICCGNKVAELPLLA